MPVDPLTNPPTVTPTPAPPPDAGREQQAIDLLQNQVRTCGGYTDADAVIAEASFTASPARPPGEYSVIATDESGTFPFTVNVDTGSVSPMPPMCQ